MTCRKTPPCGNKECRVSTTIADTLSFGSGKLDEYGFWEFPCRTCARHHEEKDRQEGFTNYMPYWPEEA